MRVGCLQGRTFWRRVLVVELPLPETNMAPENCDSLVSGRAFFWTTWKNPWGFWFRCWHPEKGPFRWWLPYSQASNSSPAGEVRNSGDFQAAVTVAGHFAPRCEAPPPPEVQKSKIGFRRTESWLQASPPPSSLHQKTVEARKEKDPKDLGRYEAQQREGNFLRTTFWGCALSVDDWVFSWSREISVWCPNLSGNGSMDASRPWGTSHPLFFGRWVFCCFKKTHPAGHTQRSDRRASGAKGKERFWWISSLRRLQMSIEKLWEFCMETPFREISAVCCHRHGIPSMPASRLFPKGKGTELEKGESRIWVFPKIVVPQNGWVKIVENLIILIKMDDLDLGVPLFSETAICSRKTSGCRSCPCRASATF